MVSGWNAVKMILSDSFGMRIWATSIALRCVNASAAVAFMISRRTPPEIPPGPVISISPSQLTVVGRAQLPMIAATVIGVGNTF